MPPETAIRAVTRVLESGLAHREVEIRWHAGEPLVVGTHYYRDVLSRLRSVDHDGTSLHHSLQTNGTLIDDDWCHLFKDENIAVGLSIDGPEDLHDRNRRTRSGRGTHQAAVRAAELLRKRGVPFTVIAVLTIDSLERVDELYDFFAGIGATQVGLNVEESETRNERSSLDVPHVADRLQSFLRRFYELASDGRLRCREFEEMKRSILTAGDIQASLMTIPGAILCVGWNGDVTGFSPELLGHHHPRYGSFLYGNVNRDTLSDMFHSLPFLQMSEDIQDGVQACKTECRYFPLCGGGAPSNKLGENGSFQSTSTIYCTFRYKATANIVLSGLEAEFRVKPS